MGRNLSAATKERRTLVSQLPLIKQISNEEGLRDMVIETWARLWRESGYRDIGEAPNYLSELDGDETLVRHTDAVARMAKAIAKELQQVYHIDLNYDFLLAGALLHDVDKLVLYQRKGDSVELTQLGQKASHAEYGARVAEQIGLPREVVNIIASHSPTQPRATPATIEAVLVACCDEANFQSYRLMTGKGLWRKPL